jgi:sarcosine oxidase subunit beta
LISPFDIRRFTQPPTVPANAPTTGKLI